MVRAPPGDAYSESEPAASSPETLPSASEPSASVSLPLESGSSIAVVSRFGSGSTVTSIEPAGWMYCSISAFSSSVLTMIFAEILT